MYVYMSTLQCRHDACYIHVHDIFLLCIVYPLETLMVNDEIHINITVRCILTTFNGKYYYRLQHSPKIIVNHHDAYRRLLTYCAWLERRMSCSIHVLCLFFVDSFIHCVWNEVFFLYIHISTGNIKGFLIFCEMKILILFCKKSQSIPRSNSDSRQG